MISVRFTAYANQHQLLPVLQWAHRSCHFSETAIVSVPNDVIGIVDIGHVGTLALSSVSHTVDHDFLVDLLHRRFGRPNRGLMLD